MIRWGSHHLLLLLWMLIPLAYGLFALRRRRERRLHKLISPEVVPVLAPDHKPSRARTRNIYWLLAVACCLLALARPQWGFHWEEVKRRGLDVMVLLDTSKSMLTEDIKPNRLQQAKWGIRDLVHKLQGDRIGLVTFAGSSFLQCPLTIDYAAYMMTLDDVYAGIIPRGGTAIGKALSKAIESFEYDTSKADKVVVLVTDGEDHDGNPERLIDELKKKNIRVYAIGVGTLDGDLIPDADKHGHPGFLKDTEGKVVKSTLKENALQKIALATGGLYVRSAPGDFGLEQIYDHGIEQLQRDEQESKMVKIFEDRFVWFLLAGLLLLVIEAFVGYKVFPRKMMQLTVILLLLCGFTFTAQAEEQPDATKLMKQGTMLYQQAERQAAALQTNDPATFAQNTNLQHQAATIMQQFQKAADCFEKSALLAEKNPDLDPAEAWFNKGDAAFRMQQFDDAAEAYQRTLSSQNLALQSRAYYNLGNVVQARVSTNSTPAFEDLLASFGQSMNFYEKGLLLTPDDAELKVNYELMLRNQQSLLAARRVIRTVLQQTKELVKAGQHAEALECLNSFAQNPQAQQALQLDADSQKKHSELQSKISEILNITQRAEKVVDEIKNNRSLNPMITPTLNP